MGNDSVLEAADSLMHHPLKQESSRTLTALGAGHDSKRSKSNMHQRRTSNEPKYSVIMDPSHQ